MEAAGRFQGGSAPSLELEGEPVTFAPATLPGHRMLRVQLRNTGREPVVLHTRDLDLIDDADQSLRASTGFGRHRDATTGSATVAPGDLLSLDFAWRARPDAGIPARLGARNTVIEFAPGDLPVHALHDVGERDRLA
jgi:hypothetical protein